MNWGKGIVIGMATFMTFIIVLVVGLMMNRVDLESEDYYKREINYQQEITAQENANKLKSKIEIISNAEFLVVKVPEGEFTKIELHLSRPNDQKMDKLFKIEGTKSFLINKKELEKGLYTVELSYMVDNKPCLQKESVTI
jgi:hypothetical protein